MPALTNPNSRFKLSLEVDENIRPLPAFIFRPLSFAEVEMLDDLEEQVKVIRSKKNQTESDRVEVLTIMFDGLFMGLVGWENIKDANGKTIAFSREKLKEILTLSEVIELVVKVGARQSPDLQFKKKSLSPLPTETSGSATPVRVRHRVQKKSARRKR